ncbi:MAG: hypothetical protein WB699_13440 [Bacteroidota bacterium]
MSSHADLDGPKGIDIVEMMKLDPDPEKARIARVDVNGETAVITLEQKTKVSRETTTINLNLEDGQWNVSPR